MSATRATLPSPLFVALDVDDVATALRLADQTQAYVGGFKVGPRLILRGGPDFLREVSARGPLFLDAKYFDIPSTMLSAVRASFDAGASFCTVHAQAGASVLKQLAQLEDELCQMRPFRILAVTVLTSFSGPDLPLTSDQPLARQVGALADLVIKSGLTGIVCSPLEIEDLAKRHPKAYLVTPGVRLAGDATGDQVRISDPASCLTLGASALVVGRPIIQSPQPALAAKTYHEEIQKIRST